MRRIRTSGLPRSDKADRISRSDPTVGGLSLDEAEPKKHPERLTLPIQPVDATVSASISAGVR